MMNLQQIGSLVVVVVAFALLVRNYIVRRKATGDGNGHCESCDVAQTLENKKPEIHYRAMKSGIK
ncbi:MAG TPA: hypothetical protein VMM58_05940 [Bacteroidota bacterium]|nr:hypothetical protein [Bacteroidota bacterium]